MILINLTFAELLGFFLTFVCLIFFTIVVLGGVMRIFEKFFDRKFYVWGYKKKIK